MVNDHPGDLVHGPVRRPREQVPVPDISSRRRRRQASDRPGVPRLIPVLSHHLLPSDPNAPPPPPHPTPSQEDGDEIKLRVDHAAQSQVRASLSRRTTLADPRTGRADDRRLAAPARLPDLDVAGARLALDHRLRPVWQPRPLRLQPRHAAQHALLRGAAVVGLGDADHPQGRPAALPVVRALRRRARVGVQRTLPITTAVDETLVTLRQACSYRRSASSRAVPLLPLLRRPRHRRLHRRPDRRRRGRPDLYVLCARAADQEAGSHTWAATGRTFCANVDCGNRSRTATRSASRRTTRRGSLAAAGHSRVRGVYGQANTTYSLIMTEQDNEAPARLDDGVELA